MVKAYSQDLREKVMTAIELDGMAITEASEMFHLARSTIYKWLNRKKETGTLEPKKRTGAKGIIQDWDKFRKLVEDNRDKTQLELAQLWPDPISQRSISRALKKIGFTRKNNLWFLKKR